VYILGNYIVLSLFLAILLSNFGDDDAEDDSEANSVGGDTPSLIDIKSNNSDEDDKKSLISTMSDDSNLPTPYGGAVAATGLLARSTSLDEVKFVGGQTLGLPTSELLQGIDDGGLTTLTPPRAIPPELAITSSSNSLFSQAGSAPSTIRSTVHFNNDNRQPSSVTPAPVVGSVYSSVVHVSRFELITPAERAIILPLARDHVIPHHRTSERKRLTRAASTLAIPISGNRHIYAGMIIVLYE
jgi:hypothetical protein